MKVIIPNYSDEDGMEIIGVYSSQKRAEQAVEEYEPFYKNGPYYSEFFLDDEIDDEVKNEG